MKKQWSRRRREREAERKFVGKIFRANRKTALRYLRGQIGRDEAALAVRGASRGKRGCTPCQSRPAKRQNSGTPPWWTPAHDRAYVALQKASERIGAAEYAAGRYSVKRSRNGTVVRGYTISEAHKAVVDALNALGRNRISPEEAMAVLHTYDVFKARTTDKKKRVNGHRRAATCYVIRWQNGGLSRTFATKRAAMSFARNITDDGARVLSCAEARSPGFVTWRDLAARPNGRTNTASRGSKGRFASEAAVVGAPTNARGQLWKVARKAAQAREAKTNGPRRKLQVGMRVQVSQGSGLASGKVGTVIDPRGHLNGRGHAPDGHTPFDHRRETMIRYEDGHIGSMFNNRLFPVGHPATRR